MGGDANPLIQKIRKIYNSWKSFNTRTIGSSPANRSTFLHTTCLRFQLPPAPPIMIGWRKDNTNKNSKLAAKAGHQPDGEDTKKDTQRSRGALVT